MSLFPPPKVMFSDSSGVPLSGGKVYFYEPGTSDLKDTYTDQAGGTANANPVILDSRGEAAIWLNGFYKVNVTESDDTQVTGYPIDNVSSGSAATSTTQTEWTSPGDTPTYISATQFSVLNDQSTVYQVYRRIKCTVGASVYYGVITAVAYTTLTTVTVSLDSGSLTSGLSIVDVGILTVTNPSIPEDVRKVASATALGHATNAGQVQGGLLTFDDDTGAADVYVGTLAPAITAYGEDMEVCIKIVNANATTTPTLNLNALGAKTIKRLNGVALLAGDLPVAHYAILRYDGTDFILLNPALHTHLDASQGGLLKRAAFSVHKNGTNQTGVVSTVWTQVTFSTEKFDNNGDFASNAFEAPYAGRFNLQAVVGFTANAANGFARLAVYKNGALYRYGALFYNPTTNLFSANIAMVVEGAVDDLFTIWAYQNSGSDKIIDGTEEVTWFTGCTAD